MKTLYKLSLALPIAWLVNTCIIYLFLFGNESFLWMNLLTSFFYSMVLSLVFWGTYSLMTNRRPEK